MAALRISDLLTQEFAAGGLDSAMVGMRQVLPRFDDALTRKKGVDVYDEMLRDPGVESPFETLKLAILSEGIRIEPAVAMPAKSKKNVDPVELADAEKAAELAEFVRENIQRLEGTECPLAEIATELLDGLAYGHKVAEMVLEREGGRLWLRKVATKDSRYVSFIVSEFMDVLGIVAANPGNFVVSTTGAIYNGDPEKIDGYVPRSKFIVFRTRSKNGDPRGESILMQAYNAWFVKTQILPDFLKYLRQFGTPLIVGKTPQNAADEYVRGPDGKPIMSGGEPQTVRKEIAMLNALLALTNSSVVVVPHGAEVDLLASAGTGEAFLDANEYFDRQIAMAILGTAQMTHEAQHESRSSKDVSQDVFGIRVAHYRGRLAGALTRDMVRLLVEANYGRQWLRLAPRVVIQSVAQQDKGALLDAYSRAYAAGFIHESQLAAIDEELGLPERDMEAIALEKEEQAMNRRLSAGELGKLKNPEGGPQGDPVIDPEEEE